MKKNLLNHIPLTKPGIKKILLTMKLALIIVFISVLQVSATVYSQINVTLDVQDQSLREVLKSIEHQTQVRFFYSDDLLAINEHIDLKADNKNIIGVLDDIFSRFPLTYKAYENDLIVIVPKETIQQNKVSGTVTDKNGATLPGVNVVITGTALGTITDDSGKFSIEVPQGAKSITFSFIGMESQEVSIGTLTQIDVTLAEASIDLEEVVVTGYGTQKKVTLTGAVVATKGEDIKRSPSTDMTNNLVGRLPGLVAVTPSGEPGYNGATLRIRGLNTLGDNSPLIVVDGIANRTMGNIAPSDIESISVLKDASAAIYGAQAANGVILVTTKRGLIGAPKISININGGFNQPTRIPELANASQYATLLNEVAFYADESGGRFQRFSEDDVQKYSDGSDPWGHPNTDWFNEVLKPWSSQNSQNVSLSGGTERMKYFLSFGARSEDGYYKNSATKYSQYDFRSNIDGKISKNITLSFDVAGRQEVRDSPTSGIYSIWSSMMQGKPTNTAYYPSGEPGPDIEQGLNPVVITTNEPGYTKDNRYILETNGRLNITIPWVKGLSLQGNASIDKSLMSYKLWEQPWYLYSWDGNPEHILQKNKKGLDTPQLTQRSSDGQGITWNVYTTFERKILEKHNVKFMVGTERQSGTYSDFRAFRRNYISTQIQELFAGASDEFMTNNGYSSQSARLNYFGRVNYDYGQKYLLEFVWRYDGSYMFPEGKQFGFFPGISGGWIISKEVFWENNIKIFDMFKLRASWGQTGNDRISEYQYLSSYGFLDNERYFVTGISNNNLILDELRIPNPNVTWEVANQSNFGFDAQLLKSRLSISADYFYNLRSQILWHRNASIPVSTGLTLPAENIGKVKNQGFEAVISYRDRVGELNYDVSVNGSYSRNEIVFWDETPGIPEYQRSTGRPIGSELYYNSLGVFKDQASIDAYPHWAGARPGDIIFEDVNTDGAIDGLDMVRSEESVMPRFIGGLSINMEYKQFDIALLIQGAAGGQLYAFTTSGEAGNYYKEFADDHWTPENTSSTTPRAYNWTQEYWASQPNTYWLRSTDYMRLKNLEIGYSLPARINQVLKIDGLRFYVNGLNLVTFDKVKIQDPESTNTQGYNYPLQRIINAGLTLTF